MANETLTAKELATLASKRMQRNVTPKEFRRFIRSNASHDDSIISACGQGNRYAISVEDAKKLLDAFASWSATRGTSVPARSLAELESLVSDETDESES